MPFTQYMGPHSVGLFLIYAITALVVWVAFNRVYLWMTPHDDIAEIKAGKIAPAVALVGAEIGFLLPMVPASIYNGGSWVAFVAWAVLAGLVQLVCFKFMYMRWPKALEDNNCAAAIVFAGAAICIGTINAFSMIP